LRKRLKKECVTSTAQRRARKSGLRSGSFLLLEHDLNFPAMSVMTQDCFISQATIRANEHTQRIFIAKSTLWIRKQNDSFVNSVERPVITMEPILVTAHSNKVALAVWERGSEVLSTTTVTVRTKDAIGFHSANET